MRRFIFSLLLSAFLFFVSAVFITAQTSSSGSNNFFQILLDVPAPRPSDKMKSPEKRERAAEFFSTENIPPDDAPIEDLLDFWERQNTNLRPVDYKPKPSEAVIRRILEVVESEPERLADLINTLPAQPEVTNAVKKLYERETGSREFGFEWFSKVRDWLRLNSDLFIEELRAKAQKVKDERGNTTNEAELKALTKLDWESAKTILERLESDEANNPRSAISAKWALYLRALETNDSDDIEKYRKELKEAVENKSFLPSVRDKAMDALVLSGDWEGRDDWYLPLLEDETLFDLREGTQWYTGLTTIISSSPPDKFLPMMKKLLDSQNTSIRNVAVRNLATMLGGSSDQKEVISLLLPWLTNPKWAKEVNGERAILIKALSETIVPEAVPDLIQLVINDEQYGSLAAQTLAEYKDPRANFALRTALAKEKNEELRGIYIESLLACGGFSDEEQLTALEAFVVMNSTEKGAETIEAAEFAQYDGGAGVAKPLPLNISIGRFISKTDDPSENLVRRVIERISFWQRTNPSAAFALRAILDEWDSPLVDLLRLQEIKSGKSDLEIIIKSLARRKELREKLSSELSLMLGENGFLKGIAAVLLEDQNAMSAILSQNDTDAQVSMLGCARMIRAKLPVFEVGKFLKNPNKLLALAAERYLESEDSIEARNLVWQSRPGEAVIVGARLAFVPNEKADFSDLSLTELFQSVNGEEYYGREFSSITKFENKLREEVKKENGLREIHAVINDADLGQAVIRVYENKYVLTFYEDESRYRQRNLTKQEIEKFRNSFGESSTGKSKSKIPSAIPASYFQYRFIPKQFLSLNRNGGRRIFSLFDPGLGKIEEIIGEFLEKGEGDFRYYLQETVKDFEILAADEKNGVRGMWKTGDDFRLWIEDAEKGIDNAKRLDESFSNELKFIFDDDLRRQKMNEYNRQREELRYAHFGWRKFANGKLGEDADEPAENPLKGTQSLDKRFNFGELRLYNENQLSINEAGNFAVMTGWTDNKAGLWKITPNQPPVLIKEGRYYAPIISKDGRKIIASRQEGEYPEITQNLMRIDLTTGKETKILIAPNKNSVPLAFVDLQNKFLVAAYPKISPQIGAGTGTVNSAANMARPAGVIVKPRIPAPPNRSVSIVSTDDDTPEPQPITLSYFLLDAETGVVSPAKGEFQPLTQQKARPLQPTNNPDEFWAAIPNVRKKETAIGSYDMKTFTFKVWRTLPKIIFESRDLIADEKDGKFYFIYKGHLLSLPMREKVQSSTEPAQTMNNK